jgi:hypothetical protein
MTNEEESALVLLAKMEAPPLDASVAARVRAIARAELVSLDAEVRTSARVIAGLRGALVPALLASATIARTAQTVEVARAIYDGGGEKRSHGE